jgi:hypothetical protein
VSLWFLFVYIEASLRLKTLRTIDFCRPFAAHCIGYPMVTLGFGFKSYLSYKLRLKRQKEIQKQNEFHTQLIAKALPLELQIKDKEKFKRTLKPIKFICASDSDQFYFYVHSVSPCDTCLIS